MKKLLTERKKIWRYVLVGATGGGIYGFIEHLARLNTENPEIFIPLMVRTVTVGILVFGMAEIFEIWSESAPQ